MFVLPHTALKLRRSGFPQGHTKFLWHKEKGNNWVLYKRNNHDISSFGDKYGYNKWVSAPTIDEAQNWAEDIKEMHREAKTAAYEMFKIIKTLVELMGDKYGERK